MTIDNPYQPPAGELGAVAVGAAPVVFSSDGALLVGSLSRWMRFMGLVYIALAGLAAIGLLAMLGLGGPGAIGLAIGLPFVIGAIAAGVWLREAGEQFNRGVNDNDVGILGVGFVNLRKYLILFGILELLALGYSLLNLVMS